MLCALIYRNLMFLGLFCIYTTGCIFLASSSFSDNSLCTWRFLPCLNPHCFYKTLYWKDWGKTWKLMAQLWWKCINRQVFITCLTRGSVPNLACGHHIFIWTKKAKWLAGHWTLKNLILSPTWSLQNVLPNSLKWIVFEIKKIQDLWVRMWAD